MAIETAETLLTTQEAAEKLGVGDRRIRSLVSQHLLNAVKEGDRLYITNESVRRLNHVDRKRGRTFSPRIAFASLYMISGESVNWLSASEKYQLKKRLTTLNATDLVSLCRNRARLCSMWCRENRLEKVTQEIRLSAGTGELAAEFNLTETSDVEGYLLESDLQRIVEQAKLRSDFQPANVRLHVSSYIPNGSGNMPIGVCSADLADSLDVRECGAGFDKLTQLLSRFQSDNKGKDSR